MRVLLDCNAYSQLMRGREQVSRVVRGAEEVLLSAVALGELLHGFRHDSRYERNISVSLIHAECPTGAFENSVSATQASATRRRWWRVFAAR